MGPQAAPLRMTPSSRRSDAQLLSTCFADAMRCPLGFPHKIYIHFADVGDGGEPVVYLLEDQPRGRAKLCGQGHGDFDPLARPSGSGVGVGAGFDGVDETEVDEVQLHFGIEAVAESGEDFGF